MGRKNISRILVNNVLPFDEKIQHNLSIRTFSENVSNEDLMWHCDAEHRLVIPLHENDWLIQLDDELPQLFSEPLFIKKDEMHRLIKGSGELKIIVKKY